MQSFFNFQTIITMDIVQEKTDELNAVLKIKLGPTDYRENVDKILRDYRKKAAMPGFRPGMVPFGLIKKMYGKGVMADEINKLLYNSLYDYLEKNKVDILGNPLPKEKEEKIDFETQEEFEFFYDMGLSPQFTVNISSKEKFTRYNVMIDDKLIEKQIKDLAKRYGKVSQPEQSGEEDMLAGEFTELDKEGKHKEGGIKHTSTIYIDGVSDDKTKKSLTGLKKDDLLTVDPKKLGKNTAEVAHLMGTDLKTAEDLKSKFEFKVNTVYHVTPAEVNQELYDKLYGKDAIKTTEEFRNKVIESLKKSMEADSQWKLMQDVKEYYIEKLKLSLPDEFLKRWLLVVNKELSNEKLEKEYDLYAKDLRWQLIENKIIRENDLKVTPEEVKESVKTNIKNYFIQYGIGEPEEARLNEMADQTLKEDKNARKYFENLYEEKVKNLFNTTFTIKVKEVSFDEFSDLVQKKQKSGLLSGLKNLIGV